jgi:hypothetical protein
VTELVATATTPGHLSVNHHGSHRSLLKFITTPSSEPGAVDAIFVPTARTVGYLRTAIGLAAKLDCPLVTLHSRHSKAAEAQRLAKENQVTLVAIDMDFVARETLPVFATTTLLAGTRFERRTDTSKKRNLGLLLARILGWKRIVFLDDDIDIPTPHHLTEAVRQLHKFNGVGLTVTGYPDNSVVCHANRETGGFQDTFIGGGALAVNAAAHRSFFPEIYNEDWFFLLSETSQLQPIARTSGIAVQKPYDPYANDQRARGEEFGDTLAEGVFWLLDQGRRVHEADERYWVDFLNKRRNFITDILDRVDKIGATAEERGRIKAALRAARGRSERITPDLCMQYLLALRTDRVIWIRHLERNRKVRAGYCLDDVDRLLSEIRPALPQSSTLVNTSHFSAISESSPSANHSRRTQSTRPLPQSR